MVWDVVVAGGGGVVSVAEAVTDSVLAGLPFASVVVSSVLVSVLESAVVMPLGFT